MDALSEGGTDTREKLGYETVRVINAALPDAKVLRVGAVSSPWLGSSQRVSPELVEVIDVFSAQRSHPSGPRQQLDVCHIGEWGLSLECATPDDPAHASEITWLLPDLGLRLTRFRPRRRHRPEPSVLTAACINYDTRTWTSLDLLLGLQVPDQGATRIVRAEDFAAAVAHGAIKTSEADYALRTVHRTLGEVLTHRDLNEWLAYHGIVASGDQDVQFVRCAHASARGSASANHDSFASA